MRDELGSLNPCAVPFLSRATANLCWYYYIPHVQQWVKSLLSCRELGDTKDLPWYNTRHCNNTLHQSLALSLSLSLSLCISLSCSQFLHLSLSALLCEPVFFSCLPLSVSYGFFLRLYIILSIFLTPFYLSRSLSI